MGGALLGIQLDGRDVHDVIHVAAADYLAYNM